MKPSVEDKEANIWHKIHKHIWLSGRHFHEHNALQVYKNGNKVTYISFDSVYTRIHVDFEDGSILDIDIDY